jgi:peptidyl-prolyl cis-trans isomerase C
MMALEAVARVNAVPLAQDDEVLSEAELVGRACVELLRQAAIEAGLLAPADPPPARGVPTPAAVQAIDTLLERELARPQPDEAECRRYYAVHRALFATGERVRLRHVLFAVTPGVNFEALRARAEACLLELRALRRADGDGFAATARTLSNCPSGADGGELGWLRAEDCAGEFAREVFGRTEVGVLPRLVRSRFGLHVVEVLERDGGATPGYESVAEAVRHAMERHAYATALRQYVQRLAGDAQLSGVALAGAATPLVQ